MWVKVKIKCKSERTGAINPRKAWAVLYRGFAIVRHRRHYTVTHLPSGMAFPGLYDAVYDARVYIDGLYFFAPKMNPAMPMPAFALEYRVPVMEAWHGWGFCWPEIEAHHQKMRAARNQKGSLPSVLMLEGGQDE